VGVFLVGVMDCFMEIFNELNFSASILKSVKDAKKMKKSAHTASRKQSITPTKKTPTKAH
jgi:hypothetical protein